MTSRRSALADGARMPVRAHLAELRKRVILIAIGIGLFAIAGWFVFDPVFEALQRPIIAAAEDSGGSVTVNFGGVATALDMRFKVAAFVGLLASSPWWLYQVWAFVAPGLTRRERKYTVGFLAAAIPLFAAGVALGAWVFPHAIDILTGFVPDNSSNFIDAQYFLSFSMRLLIAFGLAFVMPVVMVMLSWMGLVSHRTWLRGWRWAVLLIFVFAAVMTPTPDAITMIVMAIPMCGLYFLAIGIGALRARTRRK